MKGFLSLEWWGNCFEFVMKVGGVLDGSDVEKIFMWIWSRECWRVMGRVERESENEFFLLYLKL